MGGVRARLLRAEATAAVAIAAATRSKDILYRQLLRNRLGGVIPNLSVSKIKIFAIFRGEAGLRWPYAF